MKKSLLLAITVILVMTLPMMVLADEFFDEVNYKGAFGSSNWMQGWTALDGYNFLKEQAENSSQVTITDSDIEAGQNIYWTADNTYLLDGLVYVESGATLNIEAGTVIKGKADAEPTAALIICQGAKIYAEGTATDPIVFTAENDDLSDPYDVEFDTRGQWGGLIVLGKAVLNETATDGISYVEGIEEESDRTKFGGEDDEDNSGIIRYVSIRHGGAELAPGDEINGLTLGAVGSGTTIEYIEIFANKDDGIEWFGGTVNCKNLVAAFCGDDGFDHDMGLRNKMQFLFTIQDTASAGRAGEHDGGHDPEDGEPFAYPVIYNATYLGPGMESSQDDAALKLRDNWGGEYKNSIFGDRSGNALAIEYVDGYEQDSRKRLADGEIVLENNLWFNFAPGNTWEAITDTSYEADYMSGTGTNPILASSPLRSISRARDNGLDPRPVEGGDAYNNLSELPEDDFFEKVNYKGAFGSSNWMQGWTALDSYGFLKETPEAAATETIADDDIQAGDQVYWTADNTYLLDGLVYVESGATLNIEAGTVIKGKADAEPTAALIICQGAKIYAEGTATDPIVFTAENDDLSDPYDVEFDTRGQWGGLIVLGKAVLNETATDGISYVEGIEEESDRTKFGGEDDEDNSGIIRYVSIRHGGAELAPGDEINGLTLGAVGSGTTIEYIEIFANKDDGIEWFGGTVNCKNLVAAFCGDDGFDHDMGLRNKMQFLFTIQDTASAGRAGEHDGGHDPEDGEPFAYPVIYNATYLGPGMESSQDDAALKLRDNWGGEYKNSIFGDRSGNALAIEYVDGYEQDSRKRLADGEIVLENNLWFNFAPGNTWEAITDTSYEADYMSGTGTNPILASSPLRSISRARDNGLDPRPVEGGDAYNNLSEYTSGIAYEYTDFSTENIPNNFNLNAYPNPFNPVTNISFNLPEAQSVKISVYNVMGQKEMDIRDSYHAAGHHTYSINGSDLSSGIYFIRLQTENKVRVRKITLLK